VNELDTLILVVIGLSALLGAIRGMLTEVLSLLVWGAALWLTVAFGDVLGEQFTGIATPLLRSLAGYGAMFALVVIIGNLLIWLLRALLHGAGLSGTDRALGFGFGAARGYAIVLAGVLLISFTPWSRSVLWREASLMPLFTGPSSWIVAQLPDTSELVAFARPALNALPAMGAQAAQAAQASGFGAGSNDAAPAGQASVLPNIDLDLAQAAQWAGLVTQGHFSLPTATPAPSAAPASVGDSALINGQAPLDPADVQRSPPEPN
jgi:membrane protein required for colicin V production